MGTNTHGDSPPTDHVMWGQIGLGDVDRNGIIDLVEHASLPDAIVLDGLEVVLDKGPTLYVRPAIRAEEAGEVKKVILQAADFEVELLGSGGSAGPKKPLDGWSHEVLFDDADTDISALVVGDEVQIRVRGEHVFTGVDFERKALLLDETVVVQVEGP